MPNVDANITCLPNICKFLPQFWNMYQRHNKTVRSKHR